jgi:hypothetical protein
MLEEIGFLDVKIGPPVDTFKGARGKDKARLFAVFGQNERHCPTGRNPLPASSLQRPIQVMPSKAHHQLAHLIHQRDIPSGISDADTAFVGDFSSRRRA